MTSLFQFKNMALPVQLFFLFVFYFLGNILVLGALQLLSSFNISEGQSEYVLILMGATQLFTFLLPTWIFIKLIPDEFFKFISARKPVKALDWISLLALAFGTIYLVSGMSQLIMALPLGETADALQSDRKALEDSALMMNNFGDLALRLLMMAALPAICEEIFFRGVLQRLAYSMAGNIWIAIISSSVIFAMLHGSLYNLAPILVASVLLGFLYYKTKNIWYNIALHFFINGGQVVMTYILGNDQDLSQVSVSSAGLDFAFGLAVVLFVVWFLTKGKVGFDRSLVIPSAFRN